VKIFLAGATGAIGRRLAPLLRDAGHEVIGTTRSATRAAALHTMGIIPCVLDVFDADALRSAVMAATPDIVMHQLTDLPLQPDPQQIAASLTRNARLRREGTRNLVAAAEAAGVRRVIAQSIAFAYAPGPEPYAESAPLDVAADGNRQVTVDGVVTLERLVTGTPGIAGVVLRYGRLYGPGTWNETPSGKAPLHVDAAAQAAFLALAAPPGLYNIAEDDGVVAIDKARRELGFDPAFRLPS
jgi:nucleoside-diphosphate-sugar epimerase